MFGNIKPTASLSSGLLARKGQARPAMRPQGFHGTSMNLEDLGWNDMGDPAPAPDLAPAAPTPVEVVPEPLPPVLAEREKLAATIGAEIEATPSTRPVSIATATRIKREVGACKPRAAFTLRLDPERHLRLRLASAMSGRSAQSLVTEALDAMLNHLPEVEALASQLPQLKAARSSGGKS
jgi:hypothetical protein